MRHVQVLLELAAVVERPDRALIGQRRFRQHVLAPQLDAIDAELARRIVDQPLDEIDRLRPSRAAIRRRRVGVGEHAHDVDVGLGNQIDAQHGADHAERREQVAVGADIGADVGQHVEPQRHELVVLVERQLDLADIVAAVLVGHHRFAALARPFHRPQELARRPQGQAVLDILPALGAEAAADVLGDHPHLALGHLEDVLRQHVAHAMGILDVGIEGQAILALVVDAERAARLHVLGMHAGDHVAPLDDLGGALDRLVGGGLVAALDVVGDVVRAVVPHRAARRASPCPRSRSPSGSGS